MKEVLRAKTQRTRKKCYAIRSYSIYRSIAIHFTSKSIKWFLLFRFYDLNVLYTQIRKNACYVPRPSLLDRTGVCYHNCAYALKD